MGLGVQSWTGLFFTWVAIFSQSLLMMLCLPPTLLCAPWGTVLGPVFFTLYSQPPSGVIFVYNYDFYEYADNTELSKSAPPG